MTARQDAGQAVVEVSDNGIGIEAAMLPRIFELFAQVPVSIDRSQGGLGIGLTLVRKLLELHGGSIAAHSAGRGQGSTLTARIPLAPAARESRGAPVAAASALASLRILVVDDNVDAADVLVDILRYDGHLADAAYDGEAALQHLAVAPHDLVFLDLGLPGMNGYEVARCVRRTHGDKVRLIALSGYASESDRARSRDAGFDAHCVKPISEEQLRDLTPRR